MFSVCIEIDLLAVYISDYKILFLSIKIGSLFPFGFSFSIASDYSVI